MFFRKFGSVFGPKVVVELFEVFVRLQVKEPMSPGYNALINI
jgi:hypothetical protein